MQMFSNFSSEHAHFTHGMYIKALIRPLDENNEPIMFYEGMMPKFSGAVLSAFAIAVPVTSHSNFFKYAMLVHAGAERNVCNIVVSTETHQTTTTNPSQTLLPVYKLAHLPVPHSKSASQRPPQPLAQPFAQMCKRLS